MFTKELKREGKKLALDMFYHGYDNYMQNAFPDDELRPISCQGDNEMFGGLALSLIDSIDMRGIAGNATAFTAALWKIVDHVDFDKDKVVSVFEMNIRVLGGLLSAHIMARDSLGIFWKHANVRIKLVPLLRVLIMTSCWTWQRTLHGVCWWPSRRPPEYPTAVST